MRTIRVETEKLLDRLCRAELDAVMEAVAADDGFGLETSLDMLQTKIKAMRGKLADLLTKQKYTVVVPPAVVAKIRAAQ
jgi:hypothetical protein